MAENNQRKSTYTNAEISSYERHFTCMSFVMVEGRAMISFAPIFDEFVGKEPKRGDNVYDYDSKVNFAIDAQGADIARLREPACQQHKACQPGHHHQSHDGHGCRDHPLAHHVISFHVTDYASAKLSGSPAARAGASGASGCGRNRWRHKL